MVDNAIKEKTMERVESRWWQRKIPGSKTNSGSDVYTIKKQVEEERFLIILRRDDEKGEIFKIAKQMTRTNQDVVGE